MARSSTDELAVRLGSRRVGSLLNLPGDRILFSFDEAYAEDIDRPILSLSFANAEGGLKRQPSTGRVAPPYFSNLLPEGRLRRYLARLNDANETRDFPLLRALGLDLPGAVVLDPVRPETDAASRDSAEPRSDAPNQRRLKFSLAGVQLKFSAVEDAAGGLTIPASGMGGDWILKLPSVHHEDIPENEFSIMSMARLVGIEVPDVRLVSISSVAGLPAEMAQDSFRGRHALAVRRFDRESDGRRIHTEDFAQVFGVRPDRKYDGYNYSHIGRVLASLSESEAVDQFARRLMLTILVGNGDMHLKNWSLVYNDPTRPALSPAYDLLSTAPYVPDDEMALRLGGARQWRDLGIRAFTRLAMEMRVPPETLLRPARDTAEKFFSRWPVESAHLPVSRALAQAVKRQLSQAPSLHKTGERSPVAGLRP